MGTAGVRGPGVDREDLDQLAAYAGRYAPTLVAALVYPRSGEERSTGESAGPWCSTSGGTPFVFRTLATAAEACTAELAALLRSHAAAPPGRLGPLDRSPSG